VEELSGAGVRILVLRDFDKAGFSIVHSLSHDTRRYRFRQAPDVVDLGLRMADVEALHLESEPVEYDSGVDPRQNLRECGATEAECSFLVERQTGKTWSGRRVELNALDSGQFLSWLEGKLLAAGVGKVVPDPAALARSYRRASQYARVQTAIDRVVAGLEGEEIAVPADLSARVADRLAGTALSWDDVVWELARGGGT
jgi:hypothetical protein